MARTDRLFRLLQALRGLPPPVTAARLAEETGVSVRSLYRDIDSLRAAGALIDGERGYGYRLVEDGALPPQMFDRMEIEALVLGLAEVRHMGDAALAAAASSVLAKVAATLPDAVQGHMLHAVSQVYRFEQRAPVPVTLDAVRRGCWREEAVVLRYTDKAGQETERAVFPLAIVYHERSLTVLAWCCLRGDFRMFRADRIADARPSDVSFRPRRAALLRDYLARLRERGEAARAAAEGAQGDPGARPSPSPPPSAGLGADALVVDGAAAGAELGAVLLHAGRRLLLVEQGLRAEPDGIARAGLDGLLAEFGGEVLGPRPSGEREPGDQREGE